MKLNCYTGKWARKTLAGLLGLAGLFAVSSASASLLITTNLQNGTAGVFPFTPTWTIAANSLIAGQAPVVTANGNFNQEIVSSDPPRDVNRLTAIGGNDLTLQWVAGSVNNGNPTTSNNYVACGNNAGLSATYTLPASTYGCNVTNITVYSGWIDNGRDGQAYNIVYSTVDNPEVFDHLLTVIRYDGPSLPGGDISQKVPSSIQMVFSDSAGGVIASNVAKIRFDFSAPNSENGWTGYGAITIGGTSAAALTPPNLVTITENQNDPANPFTPNWTLETDSLIAGAQPATATGNFTQEGSGGVSVLTDGAIGASGSISTFATCGTSGGGTLIYTLNQSVNGSDLTNIVVYSGWGNRNRDGQYYILSYSAVTAPTTFIPITTVIYNPDIPNGPPSANRVVIKNADGAPLAQNVYSLKFDFASVPSFDNGYVGLSEIIVQGRDSAPPTAPPSPYLTDDALPAYAETMVGDTVVFTAAFSNSPPAVYQWLFISNGQTNNIAGATSETLTLNNVQLASAGGYQLKASNATNNLGVSYSSISQLVVSNAPVAVDGIVQLNAAQSGLGANGTSTDFYPTWPIDTANDLILGAALGGSLTPGNGNFDMTGTTLGNPEILTDGSFGYFTYQPGFGFSPTLVTCGVPSAGESVTYTLPGSAYGYTLTNIAVFGGWGDSGRNQQAFEVLYSTVSAPYTFNHLALVNYNPNNPGGNQSATRTMLVPSGTTALAQNVAAIQFNFNLRGTPPKNNYSGYSEIVVAGTPSTAMLPVTTQDITPLTASDVVGNQLVISAEFSGANSYQWQKDGVNIPGATSPTLTLNNLQLSDTATNGGYRLVASNGAGTTHSRACAVTVNPVPAATNNIIKSVATQTSDQQQFSPSWNVAGGSLIAGQMPADYGNGNFNDPDVNPASYNQAGGLPVLTDGTFGVLNNGNAHPAFATCGPNAGQYVTYTLDTGASPNGYTLTNIMVGSGWNDGGRDGQFYTIYYATVGSPSVFAPLIAVSNNPVLVVPANRSLLRITLTSASGGMVSNVAAVKFDFTSPPGENGYSGYNELTVYGTSSPYPPLFSIPAENQNTAEPTWVVETPNLIAGRLPASTGTGRFNGGFNGEAITEGLPALTDGILGPFDQGTTNFATCGGAFGAGQSVTYVSDHGWDLTNIVVYSGWVNYNRDGQFYNVLYSTWSAPTTFIPLASVNYNPPAQDGASANRVAITPANGNSYLARNVYAVKFDFTPQTGSLDNGYSGYSEIVLQGVNLSLVKAPTVAAPVLSGGNLILTGSGGVSGTGYTWLTSTNLVDWVPGPTGTFDGNGQASTSIPVNANTPAMFYRLSIP